MKYPDLNGKRIFVGQPLYNTNNCSMELYSQAVNYFIKKYKIDYYLPHFYSSPFESINCKILDLGGNAITLETLAALEHFSLVSFSSSLLFTTRMINPNNESIMVSYPGIPKVADSAIFFKCGVKFEN